MGSLPPAEVGYLRARVVFIDLARALAVLLMIGGHTGSALLAGEFRSGPWYELWVSQRGLTSSLFLLLAGFAFSVATARHWPENLRLSRAVLKRLGRYALFIVLGYALHVPVGRLADLAGATGQQWRSFLAVDVLQLIGVTFIAVQALVLAARTGRVFMGAAFGLAAAVILAAPAAWSVDWEQSLPLAIAAYLSPSTGSQFPLFPWAAFVLIGAGAGQLYARWGAAHLGAFATRGMLAPGAVLIAVALGMDALAAPRLGAGAWTWMAGEVLFRTGACLVILGLLAHASRHIAQLRPLFAAVARRSLLIYFVHLCIVYGSVWNRGLYQFYGEALAPGATLVAVVALAAAMVALAWQWNWLKHARPRTARWVSFAVAATLVGLLL